jgi:hypothetical protein
MDNVLGLRRILEPSSIAQSNRSSPHQEHGKEGDYSESDTVTSVHSDSESNDDGEDEQHDYDGKWNDKDRKDDRTQTSAIPSVVHPPKPYVIDDLLSARTDVVVEHITTLNHPLWTDCP